jgi:hypothetical protein
VAMYRLVPPLYKKKFCGVPSRAIVKVGCAVGKERLWNTALARYKLSYCRQHDSVCYSETYQLTKKLENKVVHYK